MPIKMEKCPYCEKSMPKHILVKHLAKSHPITPVFTDVAKEVTASETPTSVTKIVSMPWYESWDAGEMNTCQQCKQVWPSKLMFFHIKLEHGLCPFKRKLSG